MMQYYHKKITFLLFLSLKNSFKGIPGSLGRADVLQSFAQREGFLISSLILINLPHLQQINTRVLSDPGSEITNESSVGTWPLETQ